MDKHRLIVDSVVVRFGQKTVLSGGYITSETGMVTGLLGRNGAGKSCMFRALMGGLRVENVMVSIDEKPIDRQTIGRYIKYLPQGRLIPEGMQLHRAFELYGVNYWTFVNRVPKFSRHYDSPIYELSGGQARLAELYLILLSEAPFYILDEPFTQVDPVNIDEVKALIRKRSKDHGIIVTDHNYDAINWDVSLSANVFLWKGAMAYASADAGGGEITLQRTYHGVDYEYSLGLRQGFLQNRLILSVSAIMPFQNRYAGPVRDTYTDTYYQHNEGWYNPRQFRLGLAWRFGKTSINFKHARKTEVSDKL